MIDVVNLLVSSIIGGLISAAITWWFGHRYYVQSSLDLKASAREVRHLVTLLARYLDEAGAISAQWNAAGDLVGMHPITVTATQGQRATVDYKVIRAPVFTDSDADRVSAFK